MFKPYRMRMIKDISQTTFNVIKYFIVLGTLLGFFILLIASILIHDTTYIEEHPRFFLGETLFMGVLTSIPVIVICYLRGLEKTRIIINSGAIFLKIVLIHIGFQLSGVYTVFFNTA